MAVLLTKNSYWISDSSLLQQTTTRMCYPAIGTGSVTGMRVICSRNIPCCVLEQLQLYYLFGFAAFLGTLDLSKDVFVMHIIIHSVWVSLFITMPHAVRAFKVAAPKWVPIPPAGPVSIYKTDGFIIKASKQAKTLRSYKYLVICQKRSCLITVSAIVGCKRM